MFFGFCDLSLLVRGIDEPTLSRISNSILSVLAMVVIVLYVFGPVCFSAGIRKGAAVALSLYVVVASADDLWAIYTAHAAPSTEPTPVVSWLFLVFLCIINYFTMVAAWRYSRGETVRRIDAQANAVSRIGL